MVKMRECRSRASGPRRRRRSSSTPQASFLFDAARCPLYDFLGVVDADLPRDLEAVLRAINATPLTRLHRRGGFLPRAAAARGWGGDDDAAGRAALCNLTAAAAAALRRRYRDDFDLLGFDPGPEGPAAPP
jgi:hypothetical protein